MGFGAALRLLRVDAGASLRELAAAVGVSSAYLSRIENGHDPAPTPDRLVAIARALGVSPALMIELAERVGPTVAAYLGEVPAANRLFLEIARRGLSAAQVARVLAFVEAEFPDGRCEVERWTLHGLLAPERVVLGMRCASVDDVIDLAAIRLAPVFPASSPVVLAAALRAREAAASTALGRGLMVPHTSVPAGPPAGALITLATPLPGGPDGVPIRVALVLAGIADRSLALLPRAALLARGDGPAAIAAATSVEEAIRCLREAEWWGR